MWDPEHFPGADNVPWELLIRARFVRELDAIVASRITRALTEVLPAKTVARFAQTATQAVAAAPREELDGETTKRAFTAFVDFDDWCGTGRPKWPLPWPRPNWDELLREVIRHEFVDPLAVATIDRAQLFLEGAGSPDLQKQLGAALDDLAGSFRG